MYSLRVRARESRFAVFLKSYGGFDDRTGDSMTESNSMAQAGRLAAPGTLQNLFQEQRECEVIITRNREYYVSDGICFAERDRTTGLCSERSASIGVARAHADPFHDEERSAQNASWIPPVPDEATSIYALTITMPLGRSPRVGEWLCMQHRGGYRCTGPVLSVERRSVRAFK